MLTEAFGAPNQDELAKQRFFVVLLHVCFHLLSNYYDCREIIQAMQDSSAGMNLRELRRGRLGRHVDRYFTGIVDFIIEVG